jgi:MoxR-like ATPase
VSVVELRAAANLSTGAEEPWVPPVEANRLNYPQRRALEAFIKATVGPVDEAEEQQPSEPEPVPDVQPSLPPLTESERAEVESYIQRLYASGRKDLADRVGASLVNRPVHISTAKPTAKTAGKPAGTSG